MDGMREPFPFHFDFIFLAPLKGYMLLVLGGANSIDERTSTCASRYYVTPGLMLG